MGDKPKRDYKASIDMQCMTNRLNEIGAWAFDEYCRERQKKTDQGVQRSVAWNQLRAEWDAKWWELVGSKGNSLLDKHGRREQKGHDPTAPRPDQDRPAFQRRRMDPKAVPLYEAAKGKRANDIERRQFVADHMHLELTQIDGEAVPDTAALTWLIDVQTSPKLREQFWLNYDAATLKVGQSQAERAAGATKDLEDADAALRVAAMFRETEQIHGGAA